MTTKKISPRKLQANRLNAQKSTGPKTTEGKARSSRNALKHGLLARQILLDDDPHEDPADLDRLLNELVTDFAPETTVERLLVERIAACYWRLRRALRFETQAISKLRQGPQDVASQLIQQIAQTEHDPLDYVLPTASDLDKLIRYEAMIDRELNRAMNQLHRLQRARSSKPHPTNPDLQDRPPSPDQPPSANNPASPADPDRTTKPDPPAPPRKKLLSSPARYTIANKKTPNEPNPHTGRLHTLSSPPDAGASSTVPSGCFDP